MDFLHLDNTTSAFEWPETASIPSTSTIGLCKVLLTCICFGDLLARVRFLCHVASADFELHSSRLQDQIIAGTLPSNCNSTDLHAVLILSGLCSTLRGLSERACLPITCKRKRKELCIDLHAAQSTNKSIIRSAILPGFGLASNLKKAPKSTAEPPVEAPPRF